MKRTVWEFITLSAVLAAIWYFGFVKEPVSAEKSNSVTFADVKPILEFNCRYCHSAKHWDWTYYENAYNKRFQIRQRVWVLRNMPLGREMPESDRARIRDWVDQGAKE